MAQFLPDFVDRSKYYNLDVSIEMLKCSPYNNVLASAEQIACPDNFFDYVILSEVLEHVNSKIKALRECYRVLRPEGLFLLSTPRTGWRDDFKRSLFFPFMVLDKVERTLNKIFPRKAKFQIPEGVIDEPSEEDWLRETLEGIGFTVVEQYRTDNHVPWGNQGEHKFWRWFADRVVDGRKYGHCTVVVCTK